MNFEQKKHFIILFLYYTMIISIFYICFRYLIHYLLPFLIGSIISILAEPWIRKLTSYTNGHRHLWNILILLAFYAICIIIVLLFLSLLYNLTQYIISNSSTYYKNFLSPFLSTISSLCNTHPYLESLFSPILVNLNQQLPYYISTITKHCLPYLTSIIQTFPSFLFALSTTVFTSYFITFHASTLLNKLDTICPISIKPYVTSIYYYINHTLFHICIANLNLMSLTCLELWIGFLVLGISNPFIKSFGIALFDFLPIVGTGTILIPWCFILYVMNQKKHAVGLLILYFIILCVRNILEPKIMGKQLGIHPFYMLVSMYLGSQIFGFIGIFFCPILLQLIKCIIQTSKETTEIFNQNKNL